jgi:hypothetical protein
MALLLVRVAARAPFRSDDEAERLQFAQRGADHIGVDAIFFEVAIRARKQEMIARVVEDDQLVLALRRAQAAIVWTKRISDPVGRASTTHLMSRSDPTDNPAALHTTRTSPDLNRSKMRSRSGRSVNASIYSVEIPASRKRRQRWSACARLTP